MASFHHISNNKKWRNSALPPPFYPILHGGCSATGNSQISFRNLISPWAKTHNFLFLSPLCLEKEEDSDALYILKCLFHAACQNFSRDPFLPDINNLHWYRKRLMHIFCLFHTTLATAAVFQQKQKALRYL